MESRNTSGIWYAGNEGGFVLWEALVALPMLVVLMMSVTGIFCWCMRAYFVNLADAELVQEVQTAFVRVTEEAMAGKGIQESGRKSPGFDIISRQNPLYTDSQPNGEVTIGYWVHEMASLKKLVRSSLDAPLTGDHALAPVTIVEFSAVRDERYPGVYKLRLTGKSKVSRHEYTMCTAIYLPQP